MTEEVFCFKNINFCEEFTGGIGARDKVSKMVFGCSQNHYFLQVTLRIRPIPFLGSAEEIQ